MINEYCIYVQKYSYKQYSSIIQKAINYINLNITSPLSLGIVSERLKINSTYLSKMFKVETGIIKKA